MVNRRKIPHPLEAAYKWLLKHEGESHDEMAFHLADEFMYYFELGDDNP